MARYVGRQDLGLEGQSPGEAGDATDAIRLILLDQNSLDWGKRENALGWPWPREIYTVILDFCRRQGAKAVIFDVLFTEPSTYGVADDQTLGESIDNGPPFVGAVFLSDAAGAERKWPASIPVPKFKIDDHIPWLTETSAGEGSSLGGTFPVPDVARNSTVLADTHLNPDPDNVYRRMRLFSVFDGKIVPSPALGAYLAASRTRRCMSPPVFLSWVSAVFRSMIGETRF